MSSEHPSSQLRLVADGLCCTRRDPFFWIAKNDGVISWHLVLHNDPRGVHFHSGDGLKWELQQKLDAKGNPQPPHFFDEHIHQTDGTVATCAPRPCALLGM